MDRIFNIEIVDDINERFAPLFGNDDLVGGYQLYNPLKTITQIKADAKTKLESAELYTIDRLRHIDPQNVHDSNLNQNMVEIAKKLQFTPLTREDKEEIISLIQRAVSGVENSAKRVQVIDLVSQSFVSTAELVAIGKTESAIVAAVWNRAKHPKNDPKVVKENIITAFIASVENGQPLCLTGRVSRLLQALTFSDFEFRPEDLCDKQTYKNEIYSSVNRELQNKLAVWSNSSFELERQFAESYINPAIVIDPGVEKKFKDELYTSICEISDMYKDKMSAAELDKVKNETYMAIV